MASPRVQSKRAEPSALRKQVVSPEQEARARLQMLARERRMMSPQKLAAFVRQHVGPGQSVESLSLPTDSIEAVRAFQALCTIDTAMSSSSGLIKENARFMASGFVTRRVGEQEELAAALSHTKFEVSNTRKSKEGGAR
ncbi:Wadjet anti-phage system protein JetA family protein [Achromobacter xylosoxidans]|uniref:Wadjet anti-phage system protein JetA family protein n=1 Tax=Alcaligenes xylosoxydans xylosoxydans TaxID=85698 RepID=UPI0024027119|nr:Wadjet anti-phage system protein JetA family protein [Achromobacter xylosoxidans]